MTNKNSRILCSSRFVLYFAGMILSGRTDLGVALAFTVRSRNLQSHCFIWPCLLPTADRWTRSRLFQVERPDMQDEVLRDDDDDDFSAFVSGLRNWPLHPGRGPSATRSNAEKKPSLEEPFSKVEKVGVQQRTAMNKKDAMSDTTDIFPLARMRNMEALIAFALRPTTQRDDSTGEVMEGSNLSQLDMSLFDEEADSRSASASEEPRIWNMTRLEELSTLGKWMEGLRLNIGDLGTSAVGKSAEGIVRQAISQVESIIVEASTALSPSAIRAIFLQASEAARNSTVANDLVEAAKQMAVARGLEVSEAADRARQTTAYVLGLVRVADGVLRKGYVGSDLITSEKKESGWDVPAVYGSRALFANFRTVEEITSLSPAIRKGAEMGFLAGAIYEDTVARTRALAHTIVARGTTEDVVWLITDSLANLSSFQDSGLTKSSDQTFLVRTITIRGFDASDDTVDRELLLNRVCTASPERIGQGNAVLVHSGLLYIARAIYQDIETYVDWTSPSHRIILNGHSIGGSLAILILFLMTMSRGSEFVQKTVEKVYTFGSPPVASFASAQMDQGRDYCAILDAFDLPSTMVHGYVQPWDPIVRFFSEIDALYPLIGDIGDDGVTPFVSGPPRTLRPITKAILEAWEGWPRFRDNLLNSYIQNYTSVGIQHILLPDPTRYLGDRFVSVNIGVPPVESILRLSAHELYPALETGFPLDVFEISFIPQAIRSFVHHFYPAYGTPLAVYVKTLEKKSKELSGDAGDATRSSDAFPSSSQNPVGIDGRWP